MTEEIQVNRGLKLPDKQMMFTVADIAKELNGQVQGDGSVQLTGFAPATTAKAGDLTFAENEAFFGKADLSAAAAILVDGPFTSDKKAVIRVANARIAFARVLPMFFPEPTLRPAFIPPQSWRHRRKSTPPPISDRIVSSAKRSKSAPRPSCKGATISGTAAPLPPIRTFFQMSFLNQTQIGQRVRIHAGAVIGADGFGYVFDAGIHRKNPPGWPSDHP